MARGSAGRGREVRQRVDQVHEDKAEDEREADPGVRGAFVVRGGGCGGSGRGRGRGRGRRGLVLAAHDPDLSRGGRGSWRICVGVDGNAFWNHGARHGFEGVGARFGTVPLIAASAEIMWYLLSSFVAAEV